jgi:hypothetical protein
MEEQSHLAPQALNALMIAAGSGARGRPRHQHCRRRDLLGAGHDVRHHKSMKTAPDPHEMGAA